MPRTIGYSDGLQCNSLDCWPGLRGDCAPCPPELKSHGTSAECGSPQVVRAKVPSLPLTSRRKGPQCTITFPILGVHMHILTRKPTTCTSYQVSPFPPMSRVHHIPLTHMIRCSHLRAPLSFIHGVHNVIQHVKVKFTRAGCTSPFAPELRTSTVQAHASRPQSQHAACDLDPVWASSVVALRCRAVKHPDTTRCQQSQRLFIYAHCCQTP